MSQIQCPFKLGEMPQTCAQEKGEKRSGYSDVSADPAAPVPHSTRMCNGS